MIWPGTNDPYKRKSTIKFLIISAIIAISVATASTLIQHPGNIDDPLKSCIDDKNTPYKIKASLELIIDGKRADIPANIGFEDGSCQGWFWCWFWPANIGFEDGGCQRSLYTITDDGTIYAEWEDEYLFEIGHFLWVWDFPIRDMDQSKSVMLVNDEESSHFIHHPLQDGYHYKGVFTTKAYDASKDSDFLPPEN